jgi:hypothetical protein
VTVQDALKTFNKTDGILYAHPNHQMKALSKFPNDPLFNKLWGMHNTGQTGGTPGADINAPEAWDISTGSSEIVVAVIDTGVDYTHPDLAANMWVNQAELNGIPGWDDDHNFYVDDIYGYDFCNNDGDPMDDHYHGTHCAGTIGAVGNNSEGVTGVCWNVKIMALKFLNSSGSGYLDDAIDCIEYAVQMHAKLTSNSWGGSSGDPALKDAIEAAGAAGQLFVAAAGNYNENSDVNPLYPAAYDINCIISVMATDCYDDKSWFSNYGQTSVDLGAPGSDILSCLRLGGYHYLDGTSMATPHVAGACALLLSINPSLTYSQVKQILLSTVDPILPGLCVSGGRLNLFAAVLDVSPLRLGNTDDVSEGDGVGPGREITYTIDYNYPYEPNLPDINDVNIIDYLPNEVDFNSADSNGIYDPCSHTVRWNIGTLEPNGSGYVTLTVKVNEEWCYDYECIDAITITNKCEIRSSGDLYYTAYEHTPHCPFAHAHCPKPASETVGLSIPLQLSWMKGVYVADVNGHDVYFGTSEADVSSDTNANLKGTYKGRQDANVFTLDRLDYNLVADTNYYWRADEINDACTSSPWKGGTWMFRNTNCLVIDDFENYVDTNAMLARWKMGNDYNSCAPLIKAGGKIGWAYDPEHGAGVMQFDYDNRNNVHGAFYFSEARFDANGTGAGGEDWTGGGALPDPNNKARALAISYTGRPSNSTNRPDTIDPDYDRMYVAIADAAGHLSSNVVKISIPDAQRTDGQQRWDINLYDLNKPDVNLKSVKYLYLGFGVRCNAPYMAGSGTVMFDDIRLYPRRCVPEYASPDLTGDCRVDINDVNAFVDQWLSKQKTVTPVPPANDADHHLVLWYKFDDETTGRKVRNWGSCADCNGEVNSTWPTSQNDKLWATGGYDGNRCVNLNYVNAYDKETSVDVNLAALDFVDTKNALTFSIWVNADIYMPRVGWPRLISVFQDIDPCAYGENEVVEIECPVVSNPPSARFVTGLDEVSSGTLQWSDFGGGWHHYAFVKDTDTNSMRIYHNGGVIAETNNTTAPMFGLPIESFRIGRRDATACAEPWAWAGKIDDFRVYDYALSQAEVAYVMGMRGDPNYVPSPFKNVANLKNSTPEVVNFGDLAILVQEWLNQQWWP